MATLAMLEDCAEFRFVRIGCGDAAAEPWLREFLLPEPLEPDDFVAKLHRAGIEAGISLANNWHHAEIIVVERHRVTSDWLDAALELQCVVKYGSDIRSVDAEACAARQVQVVTVPRSTSVSVAEHTMMLLLVLARRYADGARIDQGEIEAQLNTPSTEIGTHPQTAFNWAGVTGIRALRGMRLAVLGAGEIARVVLRLAAAFGMELGYWSRTAAPELEEELDLTRLSWNEVAAWADVVSIHLAFSPELEGLVDVRFLEDLGEGGLIVNTSRGLLIDTEALIMALHAGRLGGAALDVFPHEPLPHDHPLRQTPHLVMTPHIGAGDRKVVLADAIAVLDAAAAV